MWDEKRYTGTCNHEITIVHFTKYALSYIVCQLPQGHFNSKPHQTLGSYWESFVDIPYQIWWPYHNDKIVFKWRQNLCKWGNLTYQNSAVALFSYNLTVFSWHCNCKFYQICVVIYRLSQIHFNAKSHQTLGSFWESFVDIPYQIWRPHHNDKIVFKWLQNLRKWGNFTYIENRQ